jgi:hypothetical protein
MDSSSERALIISLHQHRLGLESLLSSQSVRPPSEMQNEMETSSDHSAPTGTVERRAEALAWGLAMQAQSCAYLALELQQFAGELSTSRITCHELIYRRLLDSTEIFTRLLDSMRLSYAESNAHESDNSIPVLSARLVEAIRSTLVHDPATITDGSTISTERAGRTNTPNAGDTK